MQNTRIDVLVSAQLFETNQGNSIYRSSVQRLPMIVSYVARRMNDRMQQSKANLGRSADYVFF